nr:MAG TPA: zinc-ribbon domain protein [Caudoviricetes sp.]
MAIKKGYTKRTAVQARPTYRCRDCANSYDWHSKAVDGHLILCRCPYKQNGGQFCIFLKDPQCEHFKLRATNGAREKQT